MNAIVKCLGVELDEVFRIDDDDYKIHSYYKINEEGLYVSYSCNPYNWDEAFASHFMLLLRLLNSLESQLLVICIGIQKSLFLICADIVYGKMMRLITIDFNITLFSQINP